MSTGDGVSSFLTRGEDGIWRRRTSPKRSIRSRGGGGPYGTADVDAKTYSAGGGLTRSIEPNQPNPPGGPRPPAADKPEGSQHGGIRTAMGYHSRRIVETSGGGGAYRQSYAESAAAAAASKVYSQYAPRGGYSSPYGGRAGQIASADGARPSTSSAHTTAARHGGAVDGRPGTSGPASGAYAAAGIQFRGPATPSHAFRASRYTGAAQPTLNLAANGAKMAYMPQPPSSRPASQPQRAYQPRRQVYSSPGGPSSAESSPTSQHRRPREPLPLTDPESPSPSPARAPTTGWAEPSADAAPHHLRHTSLTTAKIVADLSQSQKSRHNDDARSTGDGSAAKHSTAEESTHGDGTTATTTTNPQPPPTTAPYARARVGSTPATGNPTTANAGAYSRAAHAYSADGYRGQKHTGQGPGSAGGDAAANKTMGMIPGYTVSSLLGEGGFCQVRLGIHHMSGRKVAIKMIEKHKLTDSNDRRRVAREIKVLKRMGQGNVIKLFEVIDSPAHIYIVMEHAASGSLLDYVRNRKRLSEADACWFFKQMLHGMQFCHDNQVVHRDIKLENILLDHSNRLKLIDFGLSTFIQPGKLLRVHCGSPSYAAPEIVGRKLYKGPPVDVWSSGVVLFGMIAGYLPFHAGSNKQELCQKIMRGVFKPPDNMSMECRDLLGRMLTVDPERRITIPEIFEHPWVANGPDYEADSSSVYTIHRDPFTGAVQVDDNILKEMETHGFEGRKTLECLMRNDCNYITATYFLLAEARGLAPRGGRGGNGGVAGQAGGKGAGVEKIMRWERRDDSAISMY